METDRSEMHQLPPKDAWEDFTNSAYDPYGEQARRLEVRLLITYTDVMGQVTKREISVRRYVHDGCNGIMVAHCHMRDQSRPFRIAQIGAAVEVATGELIESLPTWLDARYRESPVGQGDLLLDEHEDALLVLLYLAKADGSFRQPEKSSLSAFLVGLGASTAGADCAIEELAKGWVPPGVREFQRILVKLSATRAAYRDAILVACESVASTKKRITPEEGLALERIRQALNVDDRRSDKL